MNIRPILTANNWIIQKSGKKESTFRMFCFHNSGGSADVFSKWRELLDDNIDLCLINFPGRTKTAELIENYESLIFGLTNSILGYLDLPYAFFSFSGGSIPAFDLICRIQMMDLPLPNHFIVNVLPSPSFMKTLKKLLYARIKKSSGAEVLMEFSQALGIEQAGLFFDKELAIHAGNLLRADIIANCSRRNQPKLKIQVPITAICCDRDIFKEKDLATWSQYTSNKCSVVSVSGDHFEVLKSPGKFIHIIKELIKK